MGSLGEQKKEKKVAWPGMLNGSEEKGVNG